jgi:copper chaperone CopZ
MVHTYQISGMTCTACEATVRNKLSSVSGVKDVMVSLENHTAIITMDKHIPLIELQQALGGPAGKYQISETVSDLSTSEKASWLSTYKPILIILIYLILVTGIIQFTADSPDFFEWMEHFMGGFFLVFSFFKLLDLKGFAASYSGYDLIAKKFYSWSYIYAFIELGLGLSFISGCCPIWSNAITFVIMSVSIAGVLQAVLNKKQIQCACLGTVFNLPMTAVTIIEDALMILMSALMLFKILS